MSLTVLPPGNRYLSVPLHLQLYSIRIFLEYRNSNYELQISREVSAQKTEEEIRDFQRAMHSALQTRIIAATIHILGLKSRVTSTTCVIPRWRFFQWRNGRTERTGLLSDA